MSESGVCVPVCLKHLLSSCVFIISYLILSTALYSVILFCVFFWIPFVYFYYEEKDDDDTGKCTVSSFILEVSIWGEGIISFCFQIM